MQKKTKFIKFNNLKYIIRRKNMSNLSYFDENNLLFNSSSEKLVYFLNNQVTETASSFKFKPIKRKLSLLEEEEEEDNYDNEDMQYYYYDETNRHTIYNSENSNSKSIEQVNILK